MNLPLIKSLGIKITKHKLAILKLFDIYKHLEANKIHSLLNKKNVKISLATIYRILASFEAKNIVIKHNFNDCQAIYELLNPGEHHDHLICIKCHKVIEFFDDDIEKIQNLIAKKNQFIIVNHCLNLYGVCSDCGKINERDAL